MTRLFHFLFNTCNMFCSLHLDNYLLLQPFCTKAQFLNGKAKQDITEKLAGKVMFYFGCLFVYYSYQANSLWDGDGYISSLLSQQIVGINDVVVVKFPPIPVQTGVIADQTIAYYYGVRWKMCKYLEDIYKYLKLIIQYGIREKNEVCFVMCFTMSVSEWDVLYKDLGNQTLPSAWSASTSSCVGQEAWS